MYRCSRLVLQRNGSSLRTQSGRYGRKDIFTPKSRRTMSNKPVKEDFQGSPGDPGVKRLALAMGGLFGTIGLGLSYSEGFRDLVTIILPFVGPYLPKPRYEVASVMSVDTETTASESVEKPVEEGGGDDEHVVVNVMDVASPSQIDFEVQKETEHLEVVAEEQLVPVEVPDETPPEIDGVALQPEVAVAESVVEEVAEVVEETVAVEVAEGVTDEVTPSVTEVIIHEAEPVQEDVMPNEIVADVAEVNEVAAILSAERTTADVLAVVEHIEEGASPVPIVEPPPPVVKTEEQKRQILTSAIENLKILVDDTITTKTSVAGMLNGYISQVGQTLLLPRDEVTKESIREANLVLNHSIEESLDLVRTKESEINLQIKDILELATDIRTHGANEVADKTDELVKSSTESLQWVEAEIATLASKRDFLHGFQKHLDVSGNLENDLRVFTNDLLVLLKRKDVSLKSLSFEDALLYLSLRRMDIIYEEVEQSRKEQEAQYEANLKINEERVKSEMENHFTTVLEKLEVDKALELENSITSLNESHEINLKNKLTEQEGIHQQEIIDAKLKQETELTELHQADLKSKLSEQEDRHYEESAGNLRTVKGIESKLDDFVSFDVQIRGKQRLWAAVHELNTAINSISESGRSRKLIPEISEVLESCPNNADLSNLVANVPKAATVGGVVPESVLINSFSDIKRICKKAASVPGDDSSLLSYAFSYVKSLFVISYFYQGGMLDDVDVASLSPYAILEKADYCIQKGDLEQAAKFMSQLKGAPRKLCNEWLNETRLLLETKQSVNFLMAYVVGSLITGYD